MGRARLGLSVRAAVAGTLILLTAASCGSTTTGTATSVSTPTTATTSAAPPSPSGYPLETGARHEVTADQTGTTLEVQVGDVVIAPDAAPDVAMAIRSATETGVLVHAENTDGGLTFQAVDAGHAVVLTGPVPPPATCRDEPCDGRAAPPSITVQVNR